ncbi:MAG: SDR family NAD(P)-dependent oxidoreductase [Pseudomonadota bacterium]
MELANKSIVITGGTMGIGYEVVKRLYAANSVVVIASDADRLKRLRTEFEGVTTHQADLADPEAVREVSAKIRDSLDDLDILINNAAVQYTPSFLAPDFDYESIGREIGINFGAACCLTARLLPLLVKGGPAAVVNVNSGLALAPKTSSAVYCATKGAINTFSQSLRYQLATTNVSVLQAFMPLVDTPMTHGRGRGKLSASIAAKRLLDGVERDIENHYIGKAKLLRLMMTFAPWFGRSIMKRS